MNKFFSDLKKYSAYMRRAAQSELNAEVANSYLNWVWWILEPLCFMGIYAVIGTLAGDDTAFLLLRDSSSASALCSDIRKPVIL